MKLDNIKKQLSTVGRWMATTLFCMLAITFVWQGAFLSNNAAMADPAATLIASRDAGDQVQGKAKGFIRDAADRVEEAADSNASRVDRATDGGNFIERKAKRDRATIHQRAEEDAARTQRAVDNNVNAVERAVDGIKDAFSK